MLIFFISTTLSGLVDLISFFYIYIIWKIGSNESERDDTVIKMWISFVYSFFSKCLIIWKRYCWKFWALGFRFALWNHCGIQWQIRLNALFDWLPMLLGNVFLFKNFFAQVKESIILIVSSFLETKQWVKGVFECPNFLSLLFLVFEF